MNERQYLLIKLIEECAEVQQRATKALTFGMYESQSQGPSLKKTGEAALNNNERLAQEFTDLIAVSEMLNQTIAMPLSVSDTAAKELKKEKIKKYMSYSRSLGSLVDDSPVVLQQAAPPTCIKHNEDMVLYIYVRPGSPDGNGWACESCVKEKAENGK
jgi:hypothetical protein